jgi:hypothetical protein
MVLEDNIMKNFILAMLISIAFQVHAGDLILLDNYRLEKEENESSNLGTEGEQEREQVKLDSEASNLGAEREREWGRERREVNTDTQVKVHERRNIDDYTIRQIKNKREIVDTKEDSPLLEYQF